ncbi:MAG: carboxypeptidase regulatory-like domain-containing protein [Bacteroidota bacterium]|nr:oar protein [Odoribacter sp.]MDP3643771.1 carboxypeptidase regulatory-like domain-containing protein [Bacteroidota bacterium]
MKKMLKIYLVLIALFMVVLSGYTQVTMSSISGTVKSDKNELLIGVTIQVEHTPTGTKYYALTNNQGVYVLPAVRVGGPYTLQASFVGMANKTITDVSTSLGVTTNVNFVMDEEATKIDEVVVMANRNNVFSKERTGATQQFSRRDVQSIPIMGARTIDGITKYNSNGNGSSFGAQDSRLNNFTIDGSVFNNGFGLGSSAQAGGRTGSSAISLDAIEQLQVNIAPYDIRQSGFTGAGINAVTRSGSNKIEGSVYQTQRDNSSTFVGDNAYGVPVTASKFDEKVQGLRIGLPIIKNKLFFFGNFETLKKTEPGTNWTSTGSPLGGSQVSRPKFTDMEALSKFMSEKFNYETGPWEGYSNSNKSEKFLIRFDWNINDNHKLTARYVHHNSDAEINISNSSSAGNGNRTTSALAMSFQNSGYIIMDNTRSAVLELNSKFSNTLHNNLIVGYDKQIENRAYRSQMFPTIDIKEGTSTLTSVGFDPFTPGNKLDYNTFHITNNLTKYADKHTITAGFNFEKYKSNNLFFPASNGVYIFNSLTDFYAAANESLAKGGSPSTTALPARFQFRYSALPGAVEPLQVLKTNRLDLYVQDQYTVNDRLKVTVGLRNAIVSFDQSSIENPAITAMTFVNGEKHNTSVMPTTQILWEPRLSFNYDIFGTSKTQLRGGSGVFTGRPPYVFISNQIGNNGVLTGYIDTDNRGATKYGFTADPNKYYIPSTPTLPSTFDIALTAKDYKFPQVWKTNIAVDQKLPLGFIGTVEFIYNKNLNAVHYYNANLDAPTGKFLGVDQRVMYARTDAGVRINDNVSNAIVLTNKDGSYFNSLTLKLEYPYTKGLFGSFAWTVSNAKDYMSAGSIASGSWTGARTVNGNNEINLSRSDFVSPNRLVGLLGYKIEYGKKYGGATSVSIGYVGNQGNPFSYTISGDMNGDRISGNELMFIPLNGYAIKFQPLVVGTRTYTELEQQAALEKFISQDKYMNAHRGEYAERNGTVLPMLHRFDLSVVQDINIMVKGSKNTLQFRADILNFGNMLNNKWGVSRRVTNPSVLAYQTTVANEPVYKLATQTLPDGAVLIKDTFSRNSSVFDVWTAQLGIRYIFGN